MTNYAKMIRKLAYEIAPCSGETRRSDLRFHLLGMFTALKHGCTEVARTELANVNTIIRKERGEEC